MQITTIGLDLAKNVFQVHGVDEVGKLTITRQSPPLSPATVRGDAMPSFANSRAHLDRQNDVVIFTAQEGYQEVRFSIGPMALGELDPTADVKMAIDIYNRHLHAIHEVAARVCGAEKRTTLLRKDFGEEARRYSID
jgi:hypothetical protein